MYFHELLQWEILAFLCNWVMSFLVVLFIVYFNLGSMQLISSA